MRSVHGCIGRNGWRSLRIGVMFAREKTSFVFFSGSELCGKRGSGRGRCRHHLDEGKAPARNAFRGAADTICRSSVDRGVRLAGTGWENLAILLVVLAVKRYAFTALWCAYAAAANVIILAYFWSSSGDRPFLYAPRPI
jgi:hypothetical protein